jgi:hypothetical protein
MCVDVAGCAGNAFVGLCPGAANIRCCVRSGTPPVSAAVFANRAAQDATTTGPAAEQVNLNYLAFLAVLGAFVVVIIVVLVVRRQRQQQPSFDGMYTPLAPLSRSSSVGGRGRLSTRRARSPPRHHRSSPSVNLDTDATGDDIE